MQQVKHHRGRMSIQGRKFLMNLDETDPNVIREMFMRKFGRLITDRIIFKYTNNAHKKDAKEPAVVNMENVKRLTPRSIYMSGNTVRLTVENTVYEIPVSLFSAEFIISLRNKVANNLKDQLDCLNGTV